MLDMRRLFDYSKVPHEKRTHILAAMLFGSVLSYFLITQFMAFGQVEGNSMLPTLRDGERFLINRLVYRLREPRPGDIIEFNTPRMSDFTVKRVIALPGDVVQIKNGAVYVNGKIRQEHYLPAGMKTEGQALGENAFTVSAGAYFVLGDNRSVSLDSRMFGAISRELLVGRLWVK